MLIKHKGRLVEIGEVDQAKDEIVLDSTHGSPVRDFLAKEEEQAQEARWNNELTFHAEVEAARADPARMGVLRLIKIHLCIISSFPFLYLLIKIIFIRNIK